MVNKPKLYVFAIAINNYALKKHRLNGCHNDLNGLINYLEKYTNSESWDLRKYILKDEQATRQQIIDTFISFFSQLADGDTALFYFSGHGSQAHAPEVFWHELPGRLHETIVCYDSRTVSRDLYDKELSYLIWKVTTGKQIHFTVIMDCCHSGSATRTPLQASLDDNMGIRMRDASHKRRSWKDYLGAPHYHQFNTDVSVPVGKHILIAACRRTEKAAERNLNFKRRGVFTFGLLNALKQSKGNITYGFLLQKIQANVYNFAKDQHPQLISHGVYDQEQEYFLNGCIKQNNRLALVYYDLNKKIWIFNQGTINGLSKSFSGQSKIKIYPEQLPEGDPDLTIYKEVTLKEIHVNYAVVNMPKEVPKNKQFPAVFNYTDLPKLKIWIEVNDKCEKSNELTTILAQIESDYFDWCQLKEECDYAICIKENTYHIEHSGNRISLLPPIKEPQKFIQSLEHISAWHQVKEINNPSSNIKSEELKLSFFRVEEMACDGLEMLQEEPIKDFLLQSAELNYSYNHNRPKGEEPAFRLKLKNPLSNRRTLWCSLLFLGTDYSITNELCPLKMLQPGESHWIEAIDPTTGIYTKVIPLHLQTQYFNRGINTITEHFKLFIATEAFDTKNFQQNALAIANNLGHDPRGLFRIADLEQLKFLDWKVIDFSVKVNRSFF